MSEQRAKGLSSREGGKEHVQRWRRCEGIEWPRRSTKRKKVK
jgi:hypothetical protein